ncbi:MAG: phosphonate ABC transporter ATP-binding protein [Pseudomonadota bacterium]
MQDPAPPPLLRIADLSVTYPGGQRALHSTSLAVQRGEFLVLLGASGAGKSTLLRSINGLVSPSGGDIHVADLDGPLSQPRAMREHRRRTGMVFQQHHLIGRQSVLSNVLMGCVASRRGLGVLMPWSAADKRKALAAIERVGLIDKALVRADTLSGGQQQRVGIARALVQAPRLLLADEPVASLDPATAENVLGLLHAICKSDQLTAIVSLHQVNLARKFADRIVGLSNGRVVFTGAADNLNQASEDRLYGAPATGAIPPPETASLPAFNPPKELQPC